MSDLGKTKKLCPNGHLMDPAWDVCPYCPGDRKAGDELAKTIAVESREEGAMSERATGPELAKTIKVTDEPASAPPPGGRRTEIMDRPPAIEAVAWLVGVKDGNKGKTHQITGERTTVGADPGCEIAIGQEHVSDRHASIRFRDDAFVVTDLDSTNGTFLNGENIHQEALSDGDRVRFGSSEWIFKCVLFSD